MMNIDKKYELIGEPNKAGLRRIRALRNFFIVKKGDIGGLVESEDNLSHKGHCWIFGDVQVCNKVQVSGNMRVYGNGKLDNDR